MADLEAPNRGRIFDAVTWRVVHFCRCSKRWKVRPGWQPFSPEFAYKLLHRANYDPERALRMMDDSAFW